MTALHCDACGRELAADTAFCPYCGAERHTGATTTASSQASVAAIVIAAQPADPAPLAPAAPSTPPPSPPAPAQAPAVQKVDVEATAPRAAAPRKARRMGCATPILVVLLVILAGASWCTLRRGPSGGAPVMAGATGAQPIRVSRHWRTVRLPGDAPASARFAVSSDTALRVRAGGQLYGVRPRRPLRLPEDAGDSIDVRAADYVSAEDAARAKAALVTLRGG